MRTQERDKRKLGWLRTRGKGCFRKWERGKHLEENKFGGRARKTITQFCSQTFNKILKIIFYMYTQ
jgi:hypothetical protein